MAEPPILTNGKPKLTLPVSILIQGILLVIMGAGAYYGVSGRVALAEQRIDQETKGYLVIVAELSRRLERLEDKIDSLTLQMTTQRRRYP